MMKYSTSQAYALPIAFVIAPFLYVRFFVGGFAGQATGTDADLGLAIMAANITSLVFLGAVVFALPFLIASIIALLQFRSGNVHTAYLVHLVMLGFLAVFYGFLSLSEKTNLPFAILPAILFSLTIAADRHEAISSQKSPHKLVDPT